MTTPVEAFSRLFRILENHLPHGEIGDDEQLLPQQDPDGRLVVVADERRYTLHGFALGRGGIEVLTERANVLRMKPTKDGWTFTEFTRRQVTGSSIAPDPPAGTGEVN